VEARVDAAWLLLPALPLCAACGGRLQEQSEGGLEVIDAAAMAADDGQTSPEAGLAPSSLKCRGGDCGNGSCCASVTLGPPSGSLTISSVTSACSESPCAMGQYQLCASDAECFQAGCVDNPLGGGKYCNSACTPGATQCNSSGVQTCAPNFQWGTTVPCSAATPVCLAGSCVECTPGESQCAGADVRACDPTGQWSAATTPCSTGTRCVAGTCL
jgi:hypothetical protein